MGKMRILEIGAGTGGLSAALISVLPQDRTEYIFTDVSPFFFPHAQERFHDYPFVEYSLLDIEHSPAEQGYTPHSFDLIVAANVFHATRSLYDTLDNAASLLAPGGYSAALRATTHPVWFDVTVGLIEGWHRFADDLRRDNPLLSAEQWSSLLEARGLGSVTAFPSAHSEAQVLGQHILLARSRDVVNPPTTSAGIDSPSRVTPHSPPTRTIENLAPLLEPRIEGSSQNNLVAYLCEQLHRALRLPDSQTLDPDQPLEDLGLDSLMVVELKHQLEKALNITIPMSWFRQGVTVTQLSAFVLDELHGQPDQEHLTASCDASGSLVELQPGGDQPPLFIVAAGYGDLLA
jgi:acyl carrier protein